MKLRAVALAGLVGVLALGAVAVASPEGDSPQRQKPKLGLKRIGTFNTPVNLTSAPGYPKLVFVAEQPGRVKVLGAGRKRTFLDIRGLVRSNYEEGLFSLAFHPGYRKNRLFYVFYVDNAGNMRIDEFRRRSATRAARGSRRSVLRIRHPKYSTHNADHIAFLGRLLYASVGDGGGAGDPGDDAKDRRSLLGKLLRIDPRNPKGRADYRVPRSNPFVGRRGKDAVFAYGLRNPWRFSFDTVSAKRPRIFIGDVGQEEVEEVNYETVRATNGAFFGWDEFEGRRAYECDGRCAKGTAKPVFTYRHPRGCTVIGGYVVRDPNLSGLLGRYVFTDLCDGRIRSLRPSLRGVRGARPTGLRIDTPVSFGQDARRRLYVMSLNGAVYRIVSRR